MKKLSRRDARRQAKKSLGQNFLMHARIAERIALVAGLAPDAVVFEIGPGTGILTRELLKRAGKVIAIEADSELFEKLQTIFAEDIADGRLELIHGDIRSWDFEMYLTSRYSVKEGTCEYQVVANIPYYLTGEIFRMFLESSNQPRSMTLLVQKEVADRIVARKKKPLDSARGKESILSLSVKAYGTPKREFKVPRGAFKPAPHVDSAVLTISNISRKHFVTTEEERHFFALIHAGFAHKRKYVRKNLLEAGLPIGNIPEKTRAEDMPLSDWLALMHYPV